MTLETHAHMEAAIVLPNTLKLTAFFGKSNKKTKII